MKKIVEINTKKEGDQKYNRRQRETKIIEAGFGCSICTHFKIFDMFYEICKLDANPH
jgi:hypothetical protein